MQASQQPSGPPQQQQQQQQQPPQQQQIMAAPGPAPGGQYPPPQQQQQQYQQAQAHGGPPQQQQQQQFHQGLNGGWQSDKDYQERRKMIAKIVHLLQQRKPNAPQEWLKKLPQMAKRLEESLYRSAKSFDEYNDAGTLKQRLQQLAVNIGMKTKKMQQAQIAQQKMQQQQQHLHAQAKQAQYRAQQQQPIAANQPQPVQARPPAGQPLQQPPQQQQIRPAQPQQGQQQRLVNVSEINPIMNNQNQQMASAPAPGQPAPMQMQYQQHQGQAAAAPVAPAPQGQNGGRQSSSSRQVSDRQQVLRHQQQRLLLLRHAAKCQHEDGRCPVTPHCAGMKRLWKHIAECKDQKCLVPHCVSSRYVLSHYHRCKDVRCPVCGPVREAIHRSHEKQKQMQALKQRHQQAVQQNAQQAAGHQGVVHQTVPLAPNGMALPGMEPPEKRQKIAAAGMHIPGQGYRMAQPIQSRPMHPTSTPAMAPEPGSMAAGYAYTAQPGIQATPGPPALAPGVNYKNGQIITPKHTGPKPQEDHTLINCFSIDQIEKHIESLNTGMRLAPPVLKTKCLDVLKVLQGHQHGWVFNSPVDPVELGLPDYFEVIKNPMDLGTIRKKLENGVYTQIEEFHKHVNLTFENAMLYNPEGSVVYNMAKEMKDKFAQDYAALMKQLEIEEDAKRKNGEACLLCGCEKLLFEPPIFYCNGLSCPSKRIRRNAYYYVGGNNQYHWCHQCYQELKDNKPIELADVTIQKQQLTKKKNDETHEESWVQCDRCERWVHQICALFNTRQNKDQRSEYACPRCTIAERKQKGQSEATSTTPMAEDLQRTVLSEYLENHVRKKVDEHLEELAQEKSKLEAKPIEETRKSVEMGGAITIRQVTSMDKKLEVRERMKRRYAFKNYPDEFSYRCKCIIVFQNLDGVDVMLFGLYVYEHDETNPAPNTRTVYVSYLDSVYYMRPRSMRTFIYHEILISYLDYVRKRGFSTAHIWACPPLKGDDYILYAKPEDQKTPKDDRLRQWYIDMLVECQKRGIVGKLTNMYDLYFSDPKNDASIVPYMEGDYFPAEVENIIKDIEEGKPGSKKAQQHQKKQKNKAKQKKKSGRSGTRSSGLDEEALKASGLFQEGKDQKSLEEGGRDYVMVKLGETIQPMKESFIVAYLAWKDQKPENLVVPKEIEEYREKHGVDVDKEEESKETVGAPIKKEESSPSQNEDDSAEAKTEKKEPEDSQDVSTKETSEEAAPDEKKPEKDSEAKPMEVEGKETTAETPVDEKDKEKNDVSKEDSADMDVDKTAAAEGKAEQPEAMDTSDAKEDKDEKPSEKVGDKDEDEDDTNEPKPKEEKSSEQEPEEKDEKPTENAEEKGETEEAKSDDPEKKDSEGADTPKEEDAEAPKKEDAKEGGDVKMEDSKASENATSPAEAEATKETSDEAPPKNGDAPEVKSSEKESSDEKISEKGDDQKTPSSENAEQKPAENNSDDAKAPADGEIKTKEESKDEKKQTALTSEQMQERMGKFAAMAKKRGIDGEPKEEGKEESKDAGDDKDKEKKPAKESKSFTVKDSKGRMVKVLDDDDEELDCEFLNNRQAFLNLCQGNHYQFDQLRRAKHSSMMVLWHLHNRDAPKFVQQCTTCSREILSGNRFHCPTCADFDQCIDCVKNPGIPRHPHPLKPIPVASGQQNELTEAQRKERQRSIQLHMTLLAHAATCTSTKCPSANCTKMKGLLKHGAQCTIKATGGCNVCKRIWALLQIHARQCKLSNCRVPNCMAIRERVRQLKKQQQAMDDRRRQEMNRAYRR